MNSELEGEIIYLVVKNQEDQYSIWPNFKPIPDGWESVGKEGHKKECLEYINTVWVDMRPRSLRNAME